MRTTAFDHALLALGRQVTTKLQARGVTVHDAEDAVSEAFFKVYASLTSLTVANLNAWFYRVALNAYIDALRKRHGEQPSANLPEEAAPPPQAFYALISDLSKRDQELIALKYYYGFTYQEIAAMVGIKPASVKQALARARTKLKES